MALPVCMCAVVEKERVDAVSHNCKNMIHSIHPVASCTANMMEYPAEPDGGL